MRIPAILIKLRSTINKSTNFSPYELMGAKSPILTGTVPELDDTQYDFTTEFGTDQQWENWIKRQVIEVPEEGQTYRVQNPRNGRTRRSHRIFQQRKGCTEIQAVQEHKTSFAGLNGEMGQNFGHDLQSQGN